MGQGRAFDLELKSAKKIMSRFTGRGSILHIANTSFEEELGRTVPIDLIEILSSHPLYLQLQFLPFLYANNEDMVFIRVLLKPKF